MAFGAIVQNWFGGHTWAAWQQAREAPPRGYAIPDINTLCFLIGWSMVLQYIFGCSSSLARKDTLRMFQ